MWKQEKVHLELFERLIRERRVRPTALMPIWNILAYGLGWKINYFYLFVIAPSIYLSKIESIELSPVAQMVN